MNRAKVAASRKKAAKPVIANPPEAAFLKHKPSAAQLEQKDADRQGIATRAMEDDTVVGWLPLVRTRSNPVW